ncbi:MAG: glycoside hydrolase family 26 protein [Eubacteriales bacterium]
MKHRKKWAIALGICLLLGAVGMVLLYRSQHPYALQLKKFVKYQVLHMAPSTQKQEVEGLPEGWEMQLYVNGEQAQERQFDYNGDNKRVYEAQDRTRLVNYSDGYQMDFPAGTEFDFSLSAAVTRAEGEGYQCIISREYSPYQSIEQAMADGLAQLVPWYTFDDGIDQYIGYYQSRFLLNEGWQELNRVTVSQTEPVEAAGNSGIVYHAVIEEMPDDLYDAYSYVYLRTGGRDFIRIVLKYRHEDAEEMQGQIPQMLEEFRLFQPVGSGGLYTDFKPELPDFWTEETKELYHRIADSDDLRWGIFVEDIYGEGIETTVPQLEEELDYRFPVILSYVHSIHDFPTEFMQKNWDEGRIVELTYQLTENNNEDMFGYSPLLDLYRGKEDAIRRFARQAKEFEHPFLFRVCNEMNSDWTSYGGVVNMGDPDIFIACWRRMYEIFQEEGVNNCIWIFNPNDRNAPPSRWNDSLAYYPGNEYVQMIGVTGYNNGTYYTQWGEEWREFDVIYDHIQALYGETFGEFPWIITEFASSSVGGDKEAWIRNMFQHIGKYPNIKIAVWFSYADWDAEGNVARPYWLDETPGTVEAFREGLAGYTREGWHS